VPAGLARLEGVHNLQVEGTRLSFDVDDDAVTSALAILSTTNVHSLLSAPPSLEDLFLRHYGDELAPVDPRRASVTAR
jgi:ABC-2 type transport system ATP-binding protein